MANTVFDIPHGTAIAGKKLMVHDLTQPEATSTILVPADTYLVKKPLIGIVGGITSIDPAPGASPFQHDSLKNLGGTNGYIKIEIDGSIYVNFGINSSFTYNASTGEISGITWVTGSGLYVNLNQ